MTAVVRTIRSDTIYFEGSIPQYVKDVVETKIPNFWNGSYLMLTDKGELFEIAGGKGDWVVRQWIPDPLVEEKDNIWKMIIGATSSKQQSKISYSTKKAVKEAILCEKIIWQPNREKNEEVLIGRDFEDSIHEDFPTQSIRLQYGGKSRLERRNQKILSKKSIFLVITLLIILIAVLPSFKWFLLLVPFFYWYMKENSLFKD